MHLPYTNDYPGAVAIAGEVLGGTLTTVVWSGCFRSRRAAAAFSAAVLLAALLPAGLPSLTTALPGFGILPVLQVSATLATLSMLLERSRAAKVLAIVGQILLLLLTLYATESDFEIAFAHVFWYGLLLGTHLLGTAPPGVGWPHLGGTERRSYWRHDAAIFAVTVPLAFLVTNLAFGRLVYNGDEVANTYQANVYGHFRAYGPIPPCPEMFENYWVFRHDGRAFSQYTPGWPLFMALFARFGVIYLAGPFMAGLVAIGVARLSRRVASGLGTNPESSQRIAATAGVLGPMLAMLGPSMLLNGASRFSHTMVCGCFVWSIESLCVVSDSGVSRGRAWAYGTLLGTATSLGLATRPADGATLGVGIFAYFLWAAYRRRITWQGLAGTVLGFAIFGGLTAVILHAQLGEWFQTGYTLAPTIHPEGKLRLSWPKSNQLKYSIPFATGSYCWWPAAPALGIAGLVRSLRGRERRVAFMLVVSAFVFLTFYFFVEFGRGGDDGLGPRYLLPLVMLMAPGGAAILAPLFARVRFARVAAPSAWLRSLAAAAIATTVILYGVIRLAPFLYPVAEREYSYATGPLRGARKLGLKNAIVMILPGHSTEHVTNLAQNPPLDPNPDVLFLIRHNRADEACAQRNFPGRTWYRAGLDDTLQPW